ncbi:hypothetical protein [Aquifex sp.]
MRRWVSLLIIGAILFPSFSEAKPKKKKYYAYKYYKKYKKKYPVRRYPYKANFRINAEKLKLKEMVKELF